MRVFVSVSNQPGFARPICCRPLHTPPCGSLGSECASAHNPCTCSLDCARVTCTCTLAAFCLFHFAFTGVCMSLGFAYIPLMTHKAEPLSVCFQATWVSSPVLCAGGSRHIHPQFLVAFSLRTDDGKCRHFSQSSVIRNHGCLQARG